MPQDAKIALRVTEFWFDHQTAMSAIGTKRTFQPTSIDVRFRGQSGHKLLWCALKTEGPTNRAQSPLPLLNLEQGLFSMVVPVDLQDLVINNPVLIAAQHRAYPRTSQVATAPIS
jgi:hypothetical protein